MRKLINFAILCLFVLGTIGGIGFCIYGGSWPCACGVAVLAIMALPTVKKHIEELTK